VRGAIALLLVLAGGVAASAPTFETCRARADESPERYESYRCFFEVAAANGEWRAASARLAALASERPHNDWIVFVRAVVSAPTDADAAERLYVEAARRFEASDNVRGEVLARANLQSLYYQSARMGSAAREVERITALAERADDAETRTRARVVEAEFLIATGGDLGRAQRTLHEAEADLDAVPAYWLRRLVLQNSGNVLLLTGEYDRAASAFRRSLEEARGRGDLDSEARASLSIVNALLEKRGEEPYAVDAARLQADAHDALAAARRSGNVDLQLEALRVLAETLLTAQPASALGFAEECRRRAQAEKRSLLLSQCLWLRARLVADSDPGAARQDIDAAIQLLRHGEGADPGALAHAWRHAMRIAWQTDEPVAAIATGREALQAVERLRHLQPATDARAAAFSAWTQDYYWLSTRILRHATDANRPDLLDEAFRVAERMRARALLDLLAAPRAIPADLDAASAARRDAVLADIVEVNRKLLRATASGRAALLGRLASLERRERELRQVPHAPPVAMTASIAEVQRELAANEALLAFQTGTRDAADVGGSWAFVITRAQARVVELPDRAELVRSFALFKGMLRQSAEDRAPAARALHDRLLSDALSGLEGIERLVIVPDLPLDTFPLSALAGSHEIVLVPSATIWHQWRSRPPPARDRGALVLADPAGSPLGPLPHARAEGARILERLDGRGTVWTGSAASESAFKATDLSHHGILHFAAHAVVDGAHPDRSAILLAGGAGDQDGLLQSREIAELRLDGQLVVLSSCRSATGTRVRGEGVLGLARSFFAAGAHTVIGSLWPVRDDHAELFFDRFYAALAEGRATSAAFHDAQRALVDADLPMEAWAAFVLMGNPDAVPVRAAPARSRAIVAASLAGAFLAAVVVVGIVARRRRATRPG
jgi:CHAT domain-containing protein